MLITHKSNYIRFNKFIEKINLRKKFFETKHDKRRKKIFDVNEISFNEYKIIYNENNFINNSHIQAPGYYCSQNDVHFLKVSLDKNIVAITSIYTKYYFLNLIKIVRINDGPLFCEDYNEEKLTILIAILDFIKKNYSIFISFSLPSIFKSENNIIKIPFAIKLKYEHRKTYIINLLISEEDLKKNLRSNWRNGLKKGLKYTKVKEINNIKRIQEVLLDYKKYSEILSFDPTDYETCISWVNNYSSSEKILYLKIYEASNINNSKEIFGSIGILFFKNKALYLFGYTNKNGKKYQANSVLLWNAIKLCKEKGLKEFDLGGFNSKSPNGIKKFKEGLNGEIAETLGEYIYIGIF